MNMSRRNFLTLTGAVAVVAVAPAMLMPKLKPLEDVTVFVIENWCRKEKLFRAYGNNGNGAVDTVLAHGVVDEKDRLWFQVARRVSPFGDYDFGYQPNLPQLFMYMSNDIFEVKTGKVLKSRSGKLDAEKMAAYTKLHQKLTTCTQRIAFHKV